LRCIETATEDTVAMQSFCKTEKIYFDHLIQVNIAKQVTIGTFEKRTNKINRKMQYLNDKKQMYF